MKKTLSGVLFICIITNAGLAQTLGQKVFEKYQEQVREWQSHFTSVEFIEFQPDPNIPEVEIFQLYLSGVSNDNSLSIGMPSDLTIQRVINDNNEYSSVSASARDKYFIIYSIDKGLSTCKRDLNNKSENVKDSVAAMLINFGMNRQSALAVYKSAREKLVVYTDAELFKLIVDLNEKRLADVNDPVLAAQYAILIEAEMWRCMAGGCPVKNVFYFKNHLGTIRFWPTEDDTPDRYVYGVNQYDRKGKLVFEGTIGIFKKQAPKDKGKSFIWQILQKKSNRFYGRHYMANTGKGTEYYTRMKVDCNGTVNLDKQISEEEKKRSERVL